MERGHKSEAAQCPREWQCCSVLGKRVPGPDFILHSWASALFHESFVLYERLINFGLGENLEAGAALFRSVLSREGIQCCMMLKGPFQEDIYILKCYSFGWQSYCPFSKSYSHTMLPFGQMLRDQGEERFFWDFSQCRMQKVVKLGASLHCALITEDPSVIWLVDFVLRAKFKLRHHGVIVHHKSCALRWEFYSRVDLKWERCRRKIPTRI